MTSAAESSTASTATSFTWIGTVNLDTDLNIHTVTVDGKLDVTGSSEKSIKSISFSSLLDPKPRFCDKGYDSSVELDGTPRFCDETSFFSSSFI